MVLIPKEGRPQDFPSAYRPICLIDEAGKLFERIIVNRLVGHLSRGKLDFHKNQYGFREKRSTADAILRVRSLAEPILVEGGVALAVSLDIRNAFNTLPWDQVGGAMNTFGLPPYLVKIQRSHFRDRKLEYRDNVGFQRGKGMHRGVPQGSVLGPTL